MKRKLNNNQLFSPLRWAIKDLVAAHNKSASKKWNKSIDACREVIISEFESAVWKPVTQDEHGERVFIKLQETLFLLCVQAYRVFLVFHRGVFTKSGNVFLLKNNVTSLQGL